MKKVASKILPVALAGALQVMPMLQKVLPLQAQGVAPSAWAIVLKLSTGAIALFGYHAISSASSAVIFTMPSTNFTGTVGTPVNFLLTITNIGGDSGAYFTNAAGFPLPAGLSITTYDHPPDVHGNIVGTPTTAVTNLKVRVTANFPSGASLLTAATNININIQASAGGVGPTITNQPQSLTNVAGTTATFSVIAGGTAPLNYQWRLNTSPIAGATTNTLMLTNVHTNQAGSYTVVVTNGTGAVTSNPAMLVVTIPSAPTIKVQPLSGNQFVFTITPVVGLTNIVQTNSTVGTTNWNVLTNIPPPASSAGITITNDINDQQRYYRVRFNP